MQKKSPLVISGILVTLCLFLLLFGNTILFQPVRFLITAITMPLQQVFYTVSHTQADADATVLKENQRLRKLLVDQQKLIRENAALKDQFATISPASSTLLPATVIGAPGFVPGVSKPEMLVLAVGKNHGIKGGEAVIVNNNLIGRISQVSPALSIVELVTKSSVPFLARTSDTNATGLVYAENGALQLGNVVLAENVKKGDMVITKGNSDKKGSGYPADLIVGKIIDIEKKPSALFQTAKIQSLVDISRLTTVFIIPVHK